MSTELRLERGSLETPTIRFALASFCDATPSLCKCHRDGARERMKRSLVPATVHLAAYERVQRVLCVYTARFPLALLSCFDYSFLSPSCPGDLMATRNLRPITSASCFTAWDYFSSLVRRRHRSRQRRSSERCLACPSSARNTPRQVS